MKKSLSCVRDLWNELQQLSEAVFFFMYFFNVIKNRIIIKFWPKTEPVIFSRNKKFWCTWIDRIISGAGIFVQLLKVSAVSFTSHFWTFQFIIEVVNEPVLSLAPKSFIHLQKYDFQQINSFVLKKMCEMLRGKLNSGRVELTKNSLKILRIEKTDSKLIFSLEHKS